MGLIQCSTSTFYRDDNTGAFSFHLHKLRRADFDNLPCDTAIPVCELQAEDGERFWAKHLTVGSTYLSFYTNEPPTAKA